jgi:spermidine synthase
MAALGAEVVWTRLLSLLLGGTVYTFSIILAVFLIGLGIGSNLGALIAQGARPRQALGVCQLLLAGAVAWAATMLASSLPYWPVQPALAINPWHSFQLDLVRCLWAILPAACLWGASFPLALAAAARGTDAGGLVGRIYAANTVGAIIGAVLFSIVLVGAVGSQHAQQMLIVISALAAAVALVPLLWCNEQAREGSPALAPAAAVARTALLGAALLVAGVLAWSIPNTPKELIAYGRYLPRDLGSGTIIYHGEGLNSSVAVSLLEGGVRNFHVSGKIEASSEPQDMRLQRMLGHIPALIHPAPKTVLVVGCGAGVTAGSFVVHPSVERIVICEIEPLIPQVIAEYFAAENYDVVRNKKVEVVYDDARHFILTTREKFDVITSDPIHPWVKGAATLYTKEYFDLCKSRLNAGGVITQWIPLYESNTAAVKSELATFFAAFPEGTIWSNDYEGRGYDVVVLGQVAPLNIDVDALDARLSRPDHWQVAESLRQVGFRSAIDLLATYGGTGDGLAPWLADAQINRDRNLRLQYLAGMSPHRYRESEIYDEILRYRRYPERLFAASDETVRRLKSRFGEGNTNGR